MITELNGIQVDSIYDLQKIPQNKPGASVEVTYWRFNADTGREERHQAVIKTSLPGAPSQSRAGIGARGVMVFIVASVDENSPADQVGIPRRFTDPNQWSAGKLHYRRSKDSTKPARCIRPSYSLAT